MIHDEPMMRAAIAKAQEGIEAGQTPFGCAIAKDGQLITVAHNTVWQDTNPCAHAEVNAIRQAAIVLGTIDLSECELYTTCEPCPMCTGAIHWAKIRRCVYGATIADADAAGFNELRLPADVMAKMGGSPTSFEPGPLRDECRELFEQWHEAGRSKPY